MLPRSRSVFKVHTHDTVDEGICVGRTRNVRKSAILHTVRRQTRLIDAILKDTSYIIIFCNSVQLRYVELLWSEPFCVCVYAVLYNGL